MSFVLRVFALIGLAVLTACAAPRAEGPPPPGSAQDVARLEQAILALGPGVDPEEARRAARISYEHTQTLARQYQITDPPLIHNTKVNMGIKPRGLCWHWAKDMEARLVAEEFRTLDIHRAIANAKNPFLLEHSTAIVSRKGDTMFDGIVLDPWRKGGVLFWSRTREDQRYEWHPRAEILAWKLGRDRAQQLLAASGS